MQNETNAKDKKTTYIHIADLSANVFDDVFYMSFYLVDAISLEENRRTCG